MNDQLLIQALRLTISDLTAKLADELTTKQILAIQLAESQENNQVLGAQVAELEALLEGATKPQTGGNHDD
ncbi:hypothetical protein [Streptococcus suis]|uniref:hypothetical protein n=1 Tax=Streptococcus suis TaxID=1307 RepID=UPI00209C33AC|nr:hypothetical protein [Streptococcus suis]MCO8221056.1 hypothetical protein [Streptococcus suis]HEM3512571.1 hypothetical protein [Streptococcus suis]